MKELLSTQPGHPGLVAALQYLEKLLRDAEASDGAFKGAIELGRLARSGVTPLEVFIELASCFCYIKDHPACLPADDGTAPRYAMARAVIGLAPRPRKTSSGSLSRTTSTTYSAKPMGPDIRAVGEMLTRTLNPVLIQVYLAIEAREANKAAVVADMRMPFAPPTAALVEELAHSCSLK
ncbi:MAG TPA: hypothetical protein VHM00_15540 [Caldimonas sp.]|nr:hypothetical protein [Caldimonas sp.]HEX2542484.1 hypothetical protein [Caldimonas sp.]